MNKLIVLVIFHAFFCCNQQAQTSNVKKNVTKQYNLEVSLLDSLSEAMLGNNKIMAQTVWLQILNHKDSVVEYLLSFRGKKEVSKWYWRDLKSSKAFARNYSHPSEELSALFLICAIYYEDLSFAKSRYLYDDNILRIDKNGQFENMEKCENVDIDKIWDSVIKWNSNRSIGRPFYETQVFWICEEGGKIDRKNVVKTKWHFHG